MKKLLTIIFIVFSFIANTKEVYVSKLGMDSNTGTALKPVKTISKGLSILSSSDRLIIEIGDYQENIYFAGKAGITIEGIGNVRVLSNSLIGSYFRYAPKLIIKNIKFIGDGDIGEIVLYLYRCPESIVTRCTMSGGSAVNTGRTGLNIVSCDDALIAGNAIDYYGGINIAATTSLRAIISQNNLSHGSGISIQVDKGCDNSLITENYLHDRNVPAINEKVVVQCRDNSGSEISDNLITDNKSSFLNAILVRGVAGYNPKNISVMRNSIINESPLSSMLTRGIAISPNVVKSNVESNTIIGCSYGIATIYAGVEVITPTVSVDKNKTYRCGKGINNQYNVFDVGDNIGDINE